MIQLNPPLQFWGNSEVPQSLHEKLIPRAGMEGWEGVLRKICRNLKYDPQTQCLEWQRCKNKGYGIYGIYRVGKPNRSVLVHRWIYRVCVEEVEPSSNSVCHSCDNPACSNPYHLWQGTARDNVLDCRKKGRSGGTFTSHDSRRKEAILTPEKVYEIRNSTLSHDALSTIYGVSRRAIKHVKDRTTWASIPDKQLV